MTEHIFERGEASPPNVKQSGDYVVLVEETEEQTAVSYGCAGTSAYRRLLVSPSDATIVNDGSDEVSVNIKVVDGLEMARKTNPSDATVLNYDGDATLLVGGAETTKTLTNGSASFDLTTDKPAGSDIEIVAESLADHPAESDSATIEVVSQ